MAGDLDVPAPRERHDFIGQEAAVAALRAAEAGERLHHAWLLGGPQGVGKATLAYRFARHLLAPAAERVPGGDGLGVDPGGRTARQVAALSHPNLFALERAAAEEGKAAPKVITVEAVRKALGFFASTAADGGRRICIVDAVDDLNVAAANALLKTIEEPPPGALILLVSHAPQRVLPTIRSRCRKLPLRPLDPAEITAVLSGLDLDRGQELRGRAAAMADGSVRTALGLLDPRRIGLIDELSELLDLLPNAPLPRVLALAERVGDRRGADELPAVLDTVLRWLGVRVEARAAAGPARLAPLAELCENVAEAARLVDVYNLDRRAFIVSTFGDLAEAVRRAA
jgi:DNA polymerase-3 subunit delta'